MQRDKIMQQLMERYADSWNELCAGELLDIILAGSCGLKEACPKDKVFVVAFLLVKLGELPAEYLSTEKCAVDNYIDGVMRYLAEIQREIRDRVERGDDFDSDRACIEMMVSVLLDKKLSAMDKNFLILAAAHS